MMNLEAFLGISKPHRSITMDLDLKDKGNQY